MSMISQTGYPSIDKPWLKFYKEGVLHTSLPRQTAFDYVYQKNKEYGRGIAINYLGRKISFQELFRRIDEAAGAFAAFGVKEGDTVAICMPNTPEAVICFYALNRLGAVADMLDPRSNAEGFMEALQEIHSDLFVTIDVCMEVLHPVINKLSVKHIVIASPIESMSTITKFLYRKKQDASTLLLDEKCMSWQDFIHSSQRKYTEGVYKLNQPAVIVHTSGTTSKPKSILLSNDGMNAFALNYEISGVTISRNFSLLNIIPPFVPYGLCCSLHTFLSLGITEILIPKVVNDDFPKLLLKYKPTHVLGIPMHWNILMHSQRIMDLSFLTLPACGGDALSPELEKEINAFLKEKGCKHEVLSGYGMSEVGSSACSCMDDWNRIDSVGIPMPLNVISIFDTDTNRELRYGEVGEICIQTPTVMLCYLNNKEATAEILRIHSDGSRWVHTGDLGYMTDDGFLYVSGRIKRMIICKGFKFAPTTVEHLIEQHESVERCVVVAVPHAVDGSMPVAHIVIRKNAAYQHSIILDQIKIMCIENLKDYETPGKLVLCDSIPMTDAGKVDYRRLEREGMDMV